MLPRRQLFLLPSLSIETADKTTFVLMSGKLIIFIDFSSLQHWRSVLNAFMGLFSFPLSSFSPSLYFELASNNATNEQERKAFPELMKKHVAKATQSLSYCVLHWVCCRMTRWVLFSITPSSWIKTHKYSRYVELMLSLLAEASNKLKFSSNKFQRRSMNWNSRH